MADIDEIMDMLDWNNSIEIQEKGRELSQTIRCINVFLQPGHPGHCKNVWDNCAIILAKRSDEEFTPYLYRLLEWLIDMNWPGAPCIFERLKNYQDKDWINYVLNDCIGEAKALKEDNWLNALLELKKKCENID